LRDDCKDMVPNAVSKLCDLFEDPSNQEAAFSAVSVLVERFQDSSTLEHIVNALLKILKDNKFPQSCAPLLYL
jgi:hypothetical protein